MPMMANDARGGGRQLQRRHGPRKQGTQRGAREERRREDAPAGARAERHRAEQRLADDEDDQHADGHHLPVQQPLHNAVAHAQQAGRQETDQADDEAAEERLRPPAAKQRVHHVPDGEDGLDEPRGRQPAERAQRGQQQVVDDAEGVGEVDDVLGHLAAHDVPGGDGQEGGHQDGQECVRTGAAQDEFGAEDGTADGGAVLGRQGRGRSGGHQYADVGDAEPHAPAQQAADGGPAVHHRPFHAQRRPGADAEHAQGALQQDDALADVAGPVADGAHDAVDTAAARLRRPAVDDVAGDQEGDRRDGHQRVAPVQGPQDRRVADAQEHVNVEHADQPLHRQRQQGGADADEGGQQ